MSTLFRVYYVGAFCKRPYQIIKSLSVAPTALTAPTAPTAPTTLTAPTAPITLTFPDCPLQGLIAKSSHRQIVN